MFIIKMDKQTFFLEVNHCCLNKDHPMTNRTVCKVQPSVKIAHEVFRFYSAVRKVYNFCRFFSFNLLSLMILHTVNSIKFSTANTKTYQSSFLFWRRTAFYSLIWIETSYLKNGSTSCAKPETKTTSLNPLLITEMNDSHEVVLDTRHLNSDTYESSEFEPLEPSATQFVRAKY